ncbi:MAG: hypothetical protein HY286_14585 [Planctomycetes bacterium]|nr:hypothetical protein [Planctomycetota bacterium]
MDRDLRYRQLICNIRYPLRELVELGDGRYGESHGDIECMDGIERTPGIGTLMMILNKRICILQNRNGPRRARAPQARLFEIVATSPPRVFSFRISCGKSRCVRLCRRIFAGP